MKRKSNKARGTFSKRKMILTGSATAATAATFLIAVPTFAATNAAPPGQRSEFHDHFAGAITSVPFSELQRTRTQNAAFGIIARIQGSTITLSHYTKDGMANVTITTTSATTYKKNGVADATAELAVGQRIVAMGARDSAGHISDAASVNILVPRARTA